MVGLGYWNDWTNSLYYITDESLFSIQAILNTDHHQHSVPDQRPELGSFRSGCFQTSQRKYPYGHRSYRCPPGLCIYPFFQKYFVKGIVVGGVKG